MPHYVLPQLVDAMQRNIELYRNRWGELPQTGSPRSSGQEGGEEAGGSRGQAVQRHDSDQANQLGHETNPPQSSVASTAGGPRRQMDRKVLGSQPRVPRAAAKQARGRLQRF
ncbi:MAG: hypothetical protein R3C56_04375 [Pirellulaceae bacterium]